MIDANPHVAAIAPYALADLGSATGEPVISLAQNESAFPPSSNAVRAARDAVTDAHLYPDPDWTSLRDAIATVHDLDPASILCGTGSMELIHCLMHCYAGPGRTVVSSQFAYAFFRSAAEAVRAPYRAAPERDFTVNVDTLLEAVDADTRIVCLANPGNPTGTHISRNEVVRLRDGLDSNVLLVIDEAYGEFAGDPALTTADLVERGNTVILRTFSKAYCLAGMRVGWGVFPATIATQMRKLLNPNNIAIASQAAAAAAMADQPYMHEACREIAKLRDRIADRLRRIGFQIPESRTNFLLIPFPTSEAATRADAALRAAGFIMRGMSGYGLPECLRATIGSAAHMDRAVDILAGLNNSET